MQRFTQFYNRRHGRRGPIWEDRFQSILVEGTADALSTMAAYIDLNAVRAGLVEDPKAYRFCGYGEAVAGGREARRGMAHIAEILGQSGNWVTVSRTYRKYLFMQAGTHTKHGRTIRKKQIEKVLDAGGKLSKADLLHCRVRYFSDGVVLGSKAFVEDVFQAHREEFGLKRKTGARKSKYGQWGALCTMRDLIVDYLAAIGKGRETETQKQDFPRSYWEEERAHFRDELVELESIIRLIDSSFSAKQAPATLLAMFREGGLSDAELKNMEACLEYRDRTLQEYVKKQQRLARIANTVASEIRKVAPSEIFGNRRMPARTFLVTIDDGPDKTNGPKICDVLDQHDVKALFMFAGRMMVKFDAYHWRTYVERGHDIGNHSRDHTHNDWPRAVDGYREVQGMIEQVFPGERRWYRAPGGMRDEKFLAMIAEHNGRHVLWNVDSRDCCRGAGFLRDDCTIFADDPCALFADALTAWGARGALWVGGSIALCCHPCNSSACKKRDWHVPQIVRNRV